MRLVIVQYAGDFREAALRLESGGAETYYAQKYSIDAVTELVPLCEQVTVVCGLTAESYDEVLPGGVRAIGAGFSGAVDEEKLTAILAALDPTHLILRSPMQKLFAWATSRGIRTIGIFADAFSTKGLAARLRGWRWARLLNHPSVAWVFNHGLPSCRSLAAVGVRPEKIVPWDWPAMVSPQPEAKRLDTTAEPLLLYVGLLAEAKGVGDLLRAVGLLRDRGVKAKLEIAGGGERDRFEALSRELGLSERVSFLGLVPHAVVQEKMRAATLIVVPSRHEYAEGFPMAIYETLCSRTPLIASDHPMFAANLTHGVESLIFPAGNAAALADALGNALGDPVLYARLSDASAASWEKLQLPVKWREAVEHWLFDPPGQNSWLGCHSLRSGPYKSESEVRKTGGPEVMPAQ